MAKLLFSSHDQKAQFNYFLKFQIFVKYFSLKNRQISTVLSVYEKFLIMDNTDKICKF